MTALPKNLSAVYWESRKQGERDPFSPSKNALPPLDRLRWFRDGSCLCVVLENFDNLQRSPAVFIDLVPILEQLENLGRDGES